MKSKPRIFIGPHEIAGQYANLSKGFKRLGINYDFIPYYSHNFSYGQETKIPYLISKARIIREIRHGNKRNIFLNYLLLFIQYFLTNLWGISAIFNYDIFIFGFGHSLLSFNLDLPILFILKKTIISNLSHGSESRPPYIDGYLNSFDGIFPKLNQIYRRTKWIKRRIIFHSFFATKIIGSPYITSQFSTKPFINSLMLGLPIDLKEYENIENNDNIKENKVDKETNVIRILHAPSHPIAKGTQLIIEAIDSIKLKRPNIEFVLLKNISHQEIINQIKRCDFVVDQIYCDIPLAALGTEAAFFGKPSIVSGYALNRFSEIVPSNYLPPVKYCKPDDLEETIENFIINKNERILIGELAKKFVRSQWDSKKVALKYIDIINDNFDKKFWLDPNKINYFFGGGLNHKSVLKNIKNMIAKYGINSLGLSNKKIKNLEIFLKNKF